MKHYFFDNFVEFVDNDARSKRTWHAPVTAESLSVRHATMLPPDSVKDKRVLDLGSWIGASGHWCLAHGASHYTGVEIQPTLAETSQLLLGKHWAGDKFEILNQDLEEYLDQCIASSTKYDVILFIGVIHCFLNTFEILSKLSKVGDTIILDGPYPRDRTAATGQFIEIVKDMTSSSKDVFFNFVGAGVKISPGAVNTIMETLGFFNYDGLLYPEPLSDKSINDAYNDPISLIDIDRTINQWTVIPDEHKNLIPSAPIRFLSRYKKSMSGSRPMLKENIKKHVTLGPVKAQKTTWEFDANVAARFQEEAIRHIPDYHRVIELCLDCLNNVYDDKNVPIMDVGSATGFTVNYLKNHGYTNVHGVEKSIDMINNSLHKDNIIHSDKFPDGNWAAVLANWTLHFVKEREEYLNSIYNSLASNGLLILSDKMDHTANIEKLYHSFKQKQGVDSDSINAKKQALVGILECKPLEWYVNTLQKIGFVDIQIINSRYMFHTIYARK